MIKLIAIAIAVLTLAVPALAAEPDEVALLKERIAKLERQRAADRDTAIARAMWYGSAGQISTGIGRAEAPR